MCNLGIIRRCVLDRRYAGTGATVLSLCSSSHNQEKCSTGQFDVLLVRYAEADDGQPGGDITTPSYDAIDDEMSAPPKHGAAPRDYDLEDPLTQGSHGRMAAGPSAPLYVNTLTPPHVATGET